MAEHDAVGGAHGHRGALPWSARLPFPQHITRESLSCRSSPLEERESERANERRENAIVFVAAEIYLRDLRRSGSFCDITCQWAVPLVVPAASAQGRRRTGRLWQHFESNTGKRRRHVAAAHVAECHSRRRNRAEMTSR